jgi:putative protease
VQQNSLNYASAKFWQQQGIRRIILPRELSLAEIAEIKRHNPDLELETFVHGAICMAYSGRCLISNYLANRDANQGVCAHSCRWNYQVYQEQRLVSANQLNEQQFFLEEEKRPGELLPIAEDENGSFIMSSRDLCALKYLDQLRKSGVSSFKIEGRNKTIYYLAIITRAYRQAITDLKRGAIPDWQLLFKEVFSTANRGFIPGFLLGDLGASTIDYQKRASVSTHQFAGVVRSSNLDTQMVEIEVKNRLQLGDELEFCLPKISADFSLQLEAMYYQDQKPTTVAHGGDQNVFIKLKPAQIKLLHDAQFVVLRKKAENL